ncbi:MAG: hypothetical protein JO307_08485 [Bryobacterales bacterium]|nr:hypothetical protein [Bryobacterales bacterium]MBV9398491.1 hypothetical protein [Bryobacterales bacterium]
MHEVRVSAPEENTQQIVDLALHVGIPQATVYEVFVHGPNQRKRVVSVETSTPRAKAFIDALFAADWFDSKRYSITMRELRAIFSHQSARELTPPMFEPALEVLQDLWQLNHITPGYVARAAGAAVLMAYGMFQNSASAIVVAALFLPFLSQALAIGFGCWARDRALALQGGKALLLSTIVSIAGGALVAALYRGPFLYDHFEGPLAAFAISSIIGVAAGLSTADDAGRRYMIGVAAAVQYAEIPIWLGTRIVLGIPGGSLLIQRLGTFAINVVTMIVVAAIVYALAGMRRGEVKRLETAAMRSNTNATAAPSRDIVDPGAKRPAQRT